MSSQEQHATPSLARLLLRYGAVWLVLMLLFGATLGSAYVKLGANSAILHLGIAGLQVLLVWLLFMDLLAASALVRLCALCGLFWLIFMFSLTFGDYFTRPWNGGGTSLSERSARIGIAGEGQYPARRLPLDPTSR